MKLRTVIASTVMGLTTLGCSPKPITFPKPNSQVEPTKENTYPVPIKKKGALEDGEWEIIYQKEQVSLYKVKYRNKNITVIADWHTSLGKEAVLGILEEVKKDPKSWCILAEGLDGIKEFTPEIKDNVGKAIPLPGAGEGIESLIASNQVSQEEITIANAILILDRIARGIEVTDDQKENPLRWACSVLSDEKLSEESLRKLVLDATSTPEKLAHSVDQANRLILGMAVDVSDDMITSIVNNALNEGYNNYLIHMGEGHLRSLVKSGVVADYCKKIIATYKGDAQYIQMSLDVSKNKE